MPAQVEYRRVGKSGLRVSVPMLGCMSYGSPEWMNWVLPEDKVIPIIKAAWDKGINTFDTANMYSNGASERIVGKFIKEFNIRREKVVTLTKVCNLVSQDDMSIVAPFVPGLWNERDYVNQGGLSRIALFSQVDGCLARLETNYIDLLQIHGFDPDTPMEETMKALHDIVVSGKVRYIGASNLRAWQLAEMNSIAERYGWTQFISIQIEHSLLYRPHEEEMFPYCNFKGIGIFPYSVLMDGHLARPPRTKTARYAYMKDTIFEKGQKESDKQIIQRVDELATKHGWKMSQVAIAWSCSKTTSPIIAPNSLERLQDSITTGKTLSEDEAKYMEELYEPQPHRFYYDLRAIYRSSGASTST